MTTDALPWRRSLVTKQMTSNTIVPMRGVMQMCFVGFSIQAAVTGSVVLFTHCQAVQRFQILAVQYIIYWYTEPLI